MLEPPARFERASSPYKGERLPLSYGGVEPAAGVEPAPQHYQCRVQSRYTTPAKNGGRAENRTLISSMSRRRSALDLRALVGVAGFAPAISCTPSRRDAAFPSPRSRLAGQPRATHPGPMPGFPGGPPRRDRCQRRSKPKPRPLRETTEDYGGTAGSRTQSLWATARGAKLLHFGPECWSAWQESHLRLSLIGRGFCC